jgi:hypothetical protein
MARRHPQGVEEWRQQLRLHARFSGYVEQVMIEGAVTYGILSLVMVKRLRPK